MNKFCPSILAITVFLGLCGCATVDQKAAFNEADFRPYTAQGTASIFGHAFARTDNGVKHTAAGLTVYLVPLTPYTEERANIMVAGREPSPADPQMDKYLKSVVADMGGQFKFDGLPAGSYLVFARIEWERRRTGGDFFVVGRGTVAAGQKLHLVVSNVAN
jgi:hypothetical protein